MRQATDSDMSVSHDSHEDAGTIPAVHDQASPALTPGQPGDQAQQGHSLGVKVQRSLTWTEGTETHAGQPQALGLCSFASPRKDHTVAEQRSTVTVGYNHMSTSHNRKHACIMAGWHIQGPCSALWLASSQVV